MNQLTRRFRPTNFELWQARMQNETDRAVQGIIREDPDLNRNYPIRFQQNFQSSGRYQTVQNLTPMKIQKPIQIQKKHTENEERTKKDSDLRAKALLFRVNAQENRLFFEERRIRQEERRALLRRQENKKNEFESNGNKENDESEWQAYCRKMRNDLRNEQKPKKQKVNNIKTCRQRGARYQKKLENHEKRRMESLKNMDIHPVVYRSDKYKNSPHPRDSRMKSPLYSGDSGIDSSFSSSSIGILNSEKENLRFEDIILSSSDDETMP
ncbi:hypothetical protein B9Z55_006573 [Caenorhabditis nigoni]|uniref:Uncharacterized protein n=1 Tax=Caenorhabditis nigoni TaxID=1611254 RepID=A0A2G5V5U4_9PELO|nr:hypothetical protein B9Z55_006573 [Caenorhabditis nigoni]